MSGRDPFNSLSSCFCWDYEIVLNQNLVQDVQGLSSPYALKIAGPKLFFIDLVRPQVELNHDSGICLWGIWPLEICGATMGFDKFYKLEEPTSLPFLRVIFMGFFVKKQGGGVV